MNKTYSKFDIKDHLFVFLLMVFSIAPLYWLISHYTAGDQIYYRILYERFADVSSIRDIFALASSIVSSKEVVSPILLWLGSYLSIEKDIYVTALNFILLLMLTLFLRKNKIDWVVLIICLANYYLLVLYTGAERLKIGYIFLLFAAFSVGKLRLLMVTLSMLSHFQMILMVAGLVSYFKGSAFIDASKDLFLRFKLKINYIFGLIGTLLVLGNFLIIPGVLEGVISKGSGHLKDDGLGFANLFQFFALAACFLLAKQLRLNFNVLTFNVYFFIAIVMLGGERANMIFFTSVLAILVLEKRVGIFKPLSWPFILVLVYLSFKSIDFVNNIYLHGNGFYRA